MLYVSWFIHKFIKPSSPRSFSIHQVDRSVVFTLRAKFKSKEINKYY